MERALQFTEIQAMYEREGLLPGPHSATLETEISVPIWYGEGEFR